MTKFRVFAADVDEPVARATSAADAIDALIHESLFSVAYASREHALCDHDADECTVESDARMVEGLDRDALIAQLDATGAVSLYLDSYEWGFSASLRVEAQVPDAQITVEFDGRSLRFALNGPELSYTMRPDGTFHSYLTSASRDYIGAEVERALVSLTSAKAEVGR